MKTIVHHSPDSPLAIAARYDGEECPGSAAGIRAAVEAGKPVLRWRSLVGLRGRFQWDAIAIPGGMEPRDAWREVQTLNVDAYDRPAVYHGTLGPCAL